MLRLVIATLISLLLSACAGAPPSRTVVDDPPVAPQPQRDVTLNLPPNTVSPCADVGPIASLFERGFSALLAGRHVEAVSLFQDYKRLDGSPTAAWEADIAIAYDSMLSQSPFYDPVAARNGYGRLSVAPPEGKPVHRNSLVMRDALAVYVALLDEIAGLKIDNAALAEDLAKREEAIKRLRELTLGR